MEKQIKQNKQNLKNSRSAVVVREKGSAAEGQGIARKSSWRREKS